MGFYRGEGFSLMSAGKIALGCFILALLIFGVDRAVGYFQGWRERRNAFIRNERLNRYNMAAFRGTRKNQHL